MLDEGYVTSTLLHDGNVLSVDISGVDSSSGIFTMPGGDLGANVGTE